MRRDCLGGAGGAGGVGGAGRAGGKFDGEQAYERESDAEMSIHVDILVGFFGASSGSGAHGFRLTGVNPSAALCPDMGLRL